MIRPSVLEIRQCRPMPCPKINTVVSAIQGTLPRNRSNLADRRVDETRITVPACLISAARLREAFVHVWLLCRLAAAFIRMGSNPPLLFLSFMSHQPASGFFVIHAPSGDVRHPTRRPDRHVCLSPTSGHASWWGTLGASRNPRPSLTSGRLEHLGL